MNFWNISHESTKNTHVPYILHEMHSLASVFMCFHCVFTAEPWSFGTFHMWIPKCTWNIYSTWKAQFCYCFHVISLCFYYRNMHFWYILHVYQNTHVKYILHEMHSFASVFICLHCVFTAHTCTFGTFQIYTKIHMYSIFYMKCTVLLVFSCVLLCFYCRNKNFWYISHEFTKIHMYRKFYMKCTVLLVFS
jgi:hypothetical protein